MRTIETISGVYAAFGRGDVPAILEVLAEDVVWEYGWETHEVPWLQPRRGRQGALAFFQTVGAELEFQHFAVNHIVGDAQLVAGVVDLVAKVRATGQLIRERGEVHLWHFDDAGHVVRFRHCADTLQHWRAIQRSRT